MENRSRHSMEEYSCEAKDKEMGGMQPWAGICLFVLRYSHLGTFTG